MKNHLSVVVVGLVLSSCVAIKFPSEIKVHVSLPENISEKQVDDLIDKIPGNIGRRNINTRIEINSKEGTKVKEEKTEEDFKNN